MPLYCTGDPMIHVLATRLLTFFYVRDQERRLAARAAESEARILAALGATPAVQVDNA